MIEPVIRQDVTNLINANPQFVEQLHNKSVLVTGATGGIGRYAVSFLVENARKNNSSGMIIANVRNESKAREMFADYLDMDNFMLLVKDIGELTSIDGDIDYILHAASPTQPDDFLQRPVDIIEANVFATYNLLKIAKQKNAKFCLLSTLEVYGSVEAESYPVSVTEHSFGALDSLDLRSSYPESKRLAENLCIAYQKQFGVQSSIVRLAPVVSPIIEPGDRRVFAQFVNDVTNAKNITVYSDAGSKKRSYTYIADAVSGIFTAMLKSTSENFVFNLANNDNVVSIIELAEKIISISQNDTSKLDIIKRDDDANTSATTGLVLLDSEILMALGWTPQYSLDESIRQAIKYKSTKE